MEEMGKGEALQRELCEWKLNEWMADWLNGRTVLLYHWRWLRQQLSKVDALGSNGSEPAVLVTGSIVDLAALCGDSFNSKKLIKLFN